MSIRGSEALGLLAGVRPLLRRHGDGLQRLGKRSRTAE